MGRDETETCIESDALTGWRTKCGPMAYTLWADGLYFVGIRLIKSAPMAHTLWAFGL